MTRHSFIQMSKLSNVKGRISYITNHARQENLYATYRTADNAFWSDLAKECQQEFKRSGADGKCIEARELIIALPEVYTAYEPQQVLEDFTEKFRRRYNVECVSALHHNKKKTNYHIHLIFSERRLLAEPDIKIATRSVFYDETGKRVRTKKEIYLLRTDSIASSASFLLSFLYRMLKSPSTKPMPMPRHSFKM